MTGFLARLQASDWSRALADSRYLWPWTESAHVLLLALFLGTVFMMDLRLVGAAFRDVPVDAFTERILPWTRVAFLGMAITGVVLFLATPADYAANPFFLAKMAFLVAAGVNAWVFHRRARRDPGGAAARSAGSAARVAGALSLGLWVLVVAAGRRIPYEDRWSFPLLEAAHLVSLGVLAGSILVVDLRLLGLGLVGQTVTGLERAARPWLLGALLAVATTGGLLLWREPRNVWVLPAFWLKMSAIPFAVGYAFTVRARVTGAGDVPARVARRTALTSMALWLLVAAAGRWIGWS